MQQVVERVWLGIQSITKTSPGWESDRILGIIFWLNALGFAILFFVVGRHLYKQGRWQFNWLKCAVGAVVMVGAVGSLPAAFYSIGAKQQASDRKWQQFVAGAPARQAQARVQAIAAFRQRVATFKNAKQPYYSLPDTYTAPDGSVLPVGIMYRDLGSAASSSAASGENSGGTTLVTQFTIGRQYFTLTERLPEFRTFNYNYCLDTRPDCLFNTHLGQAHCAVFTQPSRNICQLLLGQQHMLAVEASAPNIIHPSKIYDMLALTAPEKIPLKAHFSYCTSGVACADETIAE